MLEGIYAVNFRSNQQSFGNGIAVFTADNKVGGGDDNYYYRGFLQVNNSAISGEIEVHHYQGSLNSIFPGVNNYTLTLAGGTQQASGGVLVLTGEVKQFPQMKISIQCKKISDL